MGEPRGGAEGRLGEAGEQWRLRPTGVPWKKAGLGGQPDPRSAFAGARSLQVHAKVLLSVLGSPSRIVLADPYLTGASGHCYPYLRALADGFERRGFSPVLVGSERTPDDFAAQAGVVRGFRADIRERRDAWQFWRPLGRDVRRNLAAVDEAFAFDAGTFLIINSLRHFHLEALGRWFGAIPTTRRPQLAIVLHWTAEGAGAETSLLERGYRRGFAALEAAGPGLAVLADTDELVEEFATMTSLPVSLAPIPAVDGTGDAVGRFDWGSDRRPRLLFAGEARWDKGFHLLPAAAAEIAATAGTPPPFAVQAHNPEAKTPVFNAAIADLATHGAQLIEGVLPDADYRGLIASADILVLPYSAPHYRQQSSGVFVDAAVVGKVVVAPRDTWVGRQLFEHGGGVVFRREDAADFRRAVRAAIDEFPRLQSEALVNAVDYRAFHNADRLADTLLTARARMG